MIQRLVCRGRWVASLAEKISSLRPSYCKRQPQSLTKHSKQNTQYMCDSSKLTISGRFDSIVEWIRDEGSGGFGPDVSPEAEPQRTAVNGSPFPLNCLLSASNFTSLLYICKHWCWLYDTCHIAVFITLNIQLVVTQNMQNQVQFSSSQHSS